MVDIIGTRCGLRLDHAQGRRLTIAIFAFVAKALPAGAAIAAPAQDCQTAFRADEPVPETAIAGDSLRAPADIRALIGKAEGETVVIRGGNFANWDFSGGLYPNLCFFGSDLSNSNWAGAEAQGIGFFDTDLTGAQMMGARMNDIIIRNPRLEDVDASGADWSGGYLSGGWDGSLRKLRLDRADLRGFEIDCGITIDDGCPLDRDGMRAAGADFRGATLSSFHFYDFGLTGAKFDGAVVGPRQVGGLSDIVVTDHIILEGGQRQAELTAQEWGLLRAAVAEAAAVDGAPSFDCGETSGAVESEICGPYTDDLRSLDRQLARLYGQARSIGATTLAQQRAWLKSRNACAGADFIGDCLRESYDVRLGQLLGALGDPGWLLPGRTALFVSETLPSTPEFRETALYAKIEPVLMEAAMADVVIERDADGRYAITGEAVAANAHICTLTADSIIFDRATGWYSLLHAEDGGQPTKMLPLFRYLDGRITIWRDGRPRYDGPYRELADYVSCGARASFPPLIRVDASDATVASHRAAHGATQD